MIPRKANYSMLGIIVVIVFSLLLGCSVPYDENVFETQQPGKENCEAACKNIYKLNCWNDKSTIDCELNCQQEHDEGYFWNTECLASIDSCEDIVSLCKSIIKRNDCG